jgi:hypothetical protein
MLRRTGTNARFSPGELMKRRVPCMVAAGLMAFATSCSSPSKPVLADVAWALTCSGTAPANCNPLNVAGKSWDYVQHDGEIAVDNRNDVSLGRVDATCHAVDLGSGNLRMSMRAFVGGSYIQIENLDIAEATGALLGTACRASAYDGLSLFGGSIEGRCAATAPATGSPCQITNVAIDRGDVDGPSIELRMSCSALPNSALPSSKLSVRDTSDVSQPALIRFANCGGL